MALFLFVLFSLRVIAPKFDPLGMLQKSLGFPSSTGRRKLQPIKNTLKLLNSTPCMEGNTKTAIALPRKVIETRDQEPGVHSLDLISHRH